MKPKKTITVDLEGTFHITRALMAHVNLLYNQPEGSIHNQPDPSLIMEYYSEREHSRQHYIQTLTADSLMILK